MQPRHLFSQLLLAIVMTIATGCKNETHPVDLSIRVTVDVAAKPSIVSLLDRITLARGWKKTRASVELSIFTNRPTLYFSYGRNSQDMLVTITDLKSESEIEVHAFFEESLPGVVEGVTREFTHEVKSLPGVKSVTLVTPAPQSIRPNQSFQRTAFGVR